MDFNHLYHRQQTELMRADAATCVCSRRSHQDLADLYGAIIAGGRAARGAGPVQDL